MLLVENEPPVKAPAVVEEIETPVHLVIAELFR
jgi:hypothetical protein